MSLVYGNSYQRVMELEGAYKAIKSNPKCFSGFAKDKVLRRGLLVTSSEGTLGLCIVLEATEIGSSPGRDIAVRCLVSSFSLS